MMARKSYLEIAGIVADAWVESAATWQADGLRRPCAEALYAAATVEDYAPALFDGPLPHTKLILSQRLYDKLTQRRPMPLSARIERER